MANKNCMQGPAWANKLFVHDESENKLCSLSLDRQTRNCESDEVDDLMMLMMYVLVHDTHLLAERPEPRSLKPSRA